MPGLFSAFGLLLADTEHHLTRSHRLRVPGADPARLQGPFDEVFAEGDARLAADGFPPARRILRLGVMARYAGQSSEIAVDLSAAAAPRDAAAVLAALPGAFADEHERTYGFRAPPDEPVELIALTLLARGVPEAPRLPGRIPPAAATVPPRRRAWFPATGWIDTSVTGRAGPSAAPAAGPLIVQEYDATCLVPPGATAALDGFGNIVLTLSRAGG
jgi:N-methylhydantoinase A